MLLHTSRHRLLRLLLCALAAVSSLPAQSTIGWLRYAIPPDPPRYHGLPHTVVLLGNNVGVPAPEELAAADELDRGLGHMVAGTDVLMHRFDVRLDSIVLGTTEALHRARLGRALPGWTEKPLPEEGFRIVHLRRGVREWYILQGGSPRAELWAAFRFAALVAEDQQLPEDFTDTPHLPLRAVDMGRAADALPMLEGVAPSTTGAFAGPWPRAGVPRLLASVGLNGLFLDGTPDDVARAALAVRPYGLRVWLREQGAEPASADTVARLAAAIPNLGGVVFRSPAHASLQQLRELLQTANAQARQLRRAGAAVVVEDALGPALREPSGADNEYPNEPSPEERAAVLRGALEPNVILGGAAMPASVPMAGLGSPNFGLLPGVQQIALFDVLPRRVDTLAYPAASWVAALQTPERGPRGDTAMGTLLGDTGEANLHGGVVGRLAAADAASLLQQPLLQANLYAFGRLAWSHRLNVETVTDEWSRQTWGDDARAHGIATGILMGSMVASVKNSTPLGLPLLTTATGGPDPERASSLHFGGVLADASSLGTDRSAQGTNEITRYPELFARQLTTLTQTPEEWLLLLHRLPYGAILPSGKSVAQTFYDAYFAGAAEAGNAEDVWEGTRGLIDEPRFRTVQAFLARAATRAEIWREASTEWMLQRSGVQDVLGFVGSHPGRVETGAMQLSGYVPRQTVSGSGHLLCNSGECDAGTEFTGAANVYRIEVGYLDEHGGASFELLVNGAAKAHWQDSGTQAAAEAERFTVNGVHLQPGDRVAVHATVTGGAGAPLDFIEITRDPRWN